MEGIDRWIEHVASVSHPLWLVVTIHGTCHINVSLPLPCFGGGNIDARYAAHRIYAPLYKGRLRQHGVLVKLVSKRSGQIDIDLVAWRRFG